MVNARFFPKCDPKQLETRGAKGCSSRSVVGRGKAQADARPIVSDLVNAVITLYNGKPRNGNPTIVIYAVPDLSSPLAIVGELKRDRGRYGYVLDVDVPVIPTLPGQPNAAVSSFDATTIDRTVRRRGKLIHYIEGPVLCNGTFFCSTAASATRTASPTRSTSSSRSAAARAAFERSERARRRVAGGQRAARSGRLRLAREPAVPMPP